jgi:hypothetical protein
MYMCSLRVYGFKMFHLLPFLLLLFQIQDLQKPLLLLEVLPASDRRAEEVPSSSSSEPLLCLGGNRSQHVSKYENEK